MTRPISNNDSDSFIEKVQIYFNSPDRLSNLGKLLLMNAILIGTLSAHTYTLIHFPDITSNMRKIMIVQGIFSLAVVERIRGSMTT